MKPENRKTPSGQKSAKPKHILIKLLAALLFIYAAVVLVKLNINIRTENERLASAKERLEYLTSENEQLARYASDVNIGEYMERVARDDMGYADPSERVYYIDNE